MNIQRSLMLGLALVAALSLAACETTSPSQNTASSSSTHTSSAAEVNSGSETSQAQAEESMAEQEQGAPVAVFLAATEERDGWHAIDLPKGKLFLNPTPIVVREELTGVQAGATKEGDGLVALELSDPAQENLKQVTEANPNMRLAFIVGQTLLAAPAYSAPVQTKNLIFAVGSEKNAIAVARAIAGPDAQANPTPKAD